MALLEYKFTAEIVDLETETGRVELPWSKQKKRKVKLVFF